MKNLASRKIRHVSRSMLAKQCPTIQSAITPRRSVQAIAKEASVARAGRRLARKWSEGLDLSMRNITVIATSKIAQLMDGTWDTVLTSVGRGTFLIHRRTDGFSSQCPLLCYDVRRIDGAGCRADEFRDASA